jgi:hypothetical protein
MTTKKWVGDQNAKKRADWEAKKETAATIAKMPETFRKRVEFFMRNPDWGWEFGGYEIFCCTEAVKIAEWLALSVSDQRVADRIKIFSMSTSEEQKKLVPELDYENHSGNTFGAACHLAHAYVTQPDSLWKHHGALCPLVGCKDYGCFASTKEAKGEG